MSRKVPLPPWELSPAQTHPLLRLWKAAAVYCLRCHRAPIRGQLVCEEHRPHDDGLEAYFTSQVCRLPILLDSLPLCTFCRHPFVANAAPFAACWRCVGRIWRKGELGSRVDRPDATE